MARARFIVESPDRFARDLMVQLAGHDMFKAKGVTGTSPGEGVAGVREGPPDAFRSNSRSMP